MARLAPPPLRFVGTQKVNTMCLIKRNTATKGIRVVVNYHIKRTGRLGNELSLSHYENRICQGLAPPDRDFKAFKPTTSHTTSPGKYFSQLLPIQFSWPGAKSAKAIYQILNIFENADFAQFATRECQKQNRRLSGRVSYNNAIHG